MQIEITSIQSHAEPWYLIVDLQIYSFIRLNTYYELIRSLIQVCPEASLIQIPRHMPELNPDLHPGNREVPFMLYI